MAPLVDNLASDIEYDQQHDDAAHHEFKDVESTTTTCTRERIISLRPLSSSETSQSQSQQRPKKHVSFSTYSELYYVPNVNDMTNKEYEDTYMNDDDYMRIRKEIKKAKNIMEHLQKATTTSRRYQNDIEHYHTFRGLEHVTRYAKESRRQRIDFFREAVFHEQELHGQLSPEWVLGYLANMTVPFAHAAHIMGIYDCQCSAFFLQQQD